MTRDLVDQMGDTGRAPRDLSDEHNRVEKSSLHDLTMALHYDTGKAVYVSETGEEKKAVWLPHSLIEIERHARFVQGTNKSGKPVSLPVLTVTLPEWLAKKQGLI